MPWGERPIPIPNIAATEFGDVLRRFLFYRETAHATTSRHSLAPHEKALPAAAAQYPGLRLR